MSNFDSKQTRVILLAVGTAVALVATGFALATYFPFSKPTKKRSKTVSNLPGDRDLQVSSNRESIHFALGITYLEALRQIVQHIETFYPPPSTDCLNDREQYFMTALVNGERIWKDVQPEALLETADKVDTAHDSTELPPPWILLAATEYYKALLVYPSRNELWNLYTRVVPESVVRVVKDLDKLKALV